MKGLGLAIVAAVILLAGCSMRQNITIRHDGSGTAEIHVELGSLLTRYLNDLIGSLGPEPAKGESGPVLFNLAEIRSTFADLEGVSLTGLSTPRQNQLDLRFSFRDAGSLFAQLGGRRSPATNASPLVLTHQGGLETLRFELSQATWPAVAALPVFRSDPVLASLGPQGDRRYTKAEYLNLLEYAFADYASNEKVQEALAASSVTIDVTVDGTIVSQSGGVQRGNSVVYRIPLIDFVTRGHAVDLSVTFR